jgi:hypothetical protein
MERSPATLNSLAAAYGHRHTHDSTPQHTAQRQINPVLILIRYTLNVRAPVAQATAQYLLVFSTELTAGAWHFEVASYILRTFFHLSLNIQFIIILLCSDLRGPLINSVFI